MFAEKTELNPIEDLNETAVVELNAANVDEVSGGFFPVIVAAVAVASYAAGYRAGRRR